MSLLGFVRIRESQILEKMGIIKNEEDYNIIYDYDNDYDCIDQDIEIRERSKSF